MLVTGGAGFVGGHLCAALLARGDDPVVLDDLSAGRLSNVPADVRVVVGDVRGPEPLRLLTEARFDAVVHLAAQMDVRRSVRQPRFDADVNVLGTLRALEAACDAGVPRFLFASSGGAGYGETDVLPTPESHPTRPISPYGAAKIACETYLQCFSGLRGVSTIALRFANLYGPRQDPHGEAGVVSIFAGRLLARQRCTIFGDGGSTRDYLFVDDAVRATLAALDRPVEGVCNVGSGRATSIATLHGAIARACGAPDAPLLAPARAGEQRHSVLDVSRAAVALGFAPAIGLDEGLARTVEWIRGG